MKETSHKNYTSNNIPNEEKRIYNNEARTLGILMLEHTPAPVHREARPLTDELSAGKRNVETTADKNCNSTNESHNMMKNEVTSFFQSIV